MDFNIVGNYTKGFEQSEACDDLKRFLTKRILNNKSSEKSIEEIVKVLFYSKEYKNYFYPYQKAYIIANTINVISNKIIKLILLSGDVKEILSEKAFNQSLVYYLIKEKGVDFVKSLISDKGTCGFFMGMVKDNHQTMIVDVWLNLKKFFFGVCE